MIVEENFKLSLASRTQRNYVAYGECVWNQKNWFLLKETVTFKCKTLDPKLKFFTIHNKKHRMTITWLLFTNLSMISFFNLHCPITDCWLNGRCSFRLILTEPVKYTTTNTLPDSNVKCTLNPYICKWQKIMHLIIYIIFAMHNDEPTQESFISAS